jgi:hypothetical protein
MNSSNCIFVGLYTETRLGMRNLSTTFVSTQTREYAEVADSTATRVCDVKEKVSEGFPHPCLILASCVLQVVANPVGDSVPSVLVVCGC